MGGPCLIRGPPIQLENEVRCLQLLWEFQKRTTGLKGPYMFLSGDRRNLRKPQNFSLYNGHLLRHESRPATISECPEFLKGAEPCDLCLRQSCVNSVLDHVRLSETLESRTGSGWIKKPQVLGLIYNRGYRSSPPSWNMTSVLTLAPAAPCLPRC